MNELLVVDSFGKSSVIICVIKKWSVPGARVSRSFKLSEFILNKILSSSLVFEASQPKKYFSASLWRMEEGAHVSQDVRLVHSTQPLHIYQVIKAFMYENSFFFHFGGILLHLCICATSLCCKKSLLVTTSILENF